MAHRKGQSHADHRRHAADGERDGSCAPGQNTGSAESNYAGALVADAPKTKEISHWLKYHQAAYRNATDLGSPAVDAHERHFQQIIDGELIDTRYYEGRMSHD